MELRGSRGQRVLRRALRMSTIVVMACALTAPAAAAAESRALFLTEQVSPTNVRGTLMGPVQPQHMVAQPGEEEGFLLAVRPRATARLEAVLAGGSDPFLTQWTQMLRVEWVNIRRPSTAMGGRVGRFADPLPPQVGAPGHFGAGKLLAPGGQWSAFAVLVSVPSNMPAGLHGGTVLVRAADGSTVTSMRFTLRVVPTRNANRVLDPAIAPHDPRNFKVLFNFNPNWYRNFAPADTAQEQYEQTYRTLWMLARHRVAPTHWQKAYPTGDGTYNCSAAGGYLQVFDDMPWWADGRPGAVPVALMPNHAVARCTSDGFEIKDEAGRHTKFDDRVGNVTRSAWFIYRVAEHWRRNNHVDHRTYFLNPFDEPDARQNREQVPIVNKLVHDYAPGVKVLGTTWPMDTKTARMCRRVAGVQRCATRAAQPESNVQLRDGGGDDLDGWIVPYFRAWGFGVNRNQMLAGVNRSREVLGRLRGIQARGGEAWTYDLPLGTSKVPQIAIDAPSTDARFLFWPLARDGFDGWFIAVSNRWVDPVAVTRPRNPWDDPLSWVGSQTADRDNAGPHGVVSNGWGSLYYPGVRPQLGLTDPLAQPVSSLRLERMRDGVEDANLMRQYRARYGAAALNRKLLGVMGAMTSNPALPGRETFPRYTNAGLALRMELLRRQMIAELSR